MKRRAIASLVFGAFLVAGAAQQRSSTPEALLGRAIHQEDAEGDLEAAIATYKEFLAQHGDNRPLAAKAQFRLGTSYEKLGRVEARKAYERVLADYADQTDLVAQARARLAALDTAAANQGLGVTIRKLQIKDAIRPWTVSADGRYLGATDFVTFNPSVIDLVKGQSRNLTDYANRPGERGFSQYGAISRDGKQIAFWHYKYGSTEGNLRVIGTDGKGERTLYRSKDAVSWGIPDDWSPDGKHVVVQQDDGVAFGLVSVADGSVRVIKTFEPVRRYRPKIVFSPDGRYLAYDYPPRKEVVHGDIFVLPVNGGPEVALATHPAQDTFLGWAPDGSILFTSDRTGSMGLHRVKVTNGRQAGEPELLRPNIGPIEPLGITRSGGLYYGQRSDLRKAYLASVDFKTGKLTAAPRVLTERFSDSTANPAWSADGRQLAYTHPREDGAPSTLIIRPDGGGEEREILPAIRISAGARMRWHADGDSLFALGAGETESGLYRIDAKTGEAALLMEMSNVAFWAAADWTPDGKSVFLVKNSAIIRRDLVSGEEKILYGPAPEMRALPSTVRRTRSLRVSPDGQQLVFVERRSAEDPQHVLRLLSIEGGEVRDLFTDGRLLTSRQRLAWTPDGRHILFFTWYGTRANGPRVSLWSIPTNGGKARKAEITIQGEPRELNIHPDGKRIVFSTLEPKTEYWVMENFLPHD